MLIPNIVSQFKLYKDFLSNDYNNHQFSDTMNHKIAIVLLLINNNKLC